MAAQTPELDAALGSLADAMDTPTWDDMVSQAAAMTPLGTAPVGMSTDKATLKHTRGGTPSTRGRGRGGRGIGRGQPPPKSRGSKPQRGGHRVSLPTTPEESGVSLTAALSGIPGSDNGKAPVVPLEVEEDLDKLSEVTSVHTERIASLESELEGAKETISALLEDQRMIMSEVSDLKKQITSIKAGMNKGEKGKGAKGPDARGASKLQPGRELIVATASSPQGSQDSVVATGPSWKKRLNL